MLAICSLMFVGGVVAYYAHTRNAMWQEMLGVCESARRENNKINAMESEIEFLRDYSKAQQQDGSKNSALTSAKLLMSAEKESELLRRKEEYSELKLRIVANKLSGADDLAESEEDLETTNDKIAANEAEILRFKQSFDAAQQDGCEYAALAVQRNIKRMEEEAEYLVRRKARAEARKQRILGKASN